MALDQVKTQVLILHSEQSALDSLSASIDDRYTVHCATTGTEALNTLGDTPIHVIISAQNLPGMSGVEALREAKKRSPETIGILLAGNDDKNVEALVGEKEVFQVIRGGISSDELAKLIDNATQQMRLLALAESANDTAANPDEISSEHIIMETGEFGAMIISDGTGQVPALDAKKISAAEAAGANAVDILVLTKDEDFLSTVKESARGMHNVRYATTLAQAEEALAKCNVGVAVVDAAMVGAKVEKLTMHLRKRKQRLVNIVAGRRDDGEMLMDLINRGRVYRFLLKPVSPGRARLAIEASVKHHLEAPDSAFKLVASAAPAPAAAKAAPKPAPAAKAAPGKPSAPKPAPPAGDGGAATQPGPDSLRVSAADSLSTPFDEGDSGFAQTMTNIVGKVGKTFGKKKDGPDSTTLESAMPVGSGDGTGSSPSGVPKLLGFGAAAAVAIAAVGAWLYFGGGDAPAPVTSPESTEAPAADAETQAPAPPAETPRQATMSANEVLDEARLARDAGQIVYPEGNNAIELYLRAAELDPDDPGVAAELADVLDEAFALAETALLERRTDEAADALARVRSADPDHARLAFLTAQLTQMQLRDYLDGARAAIRDERFEDASTALAAASGLDAGNTTEIDAVAAELADARSAQRVDDVLAQAAARLEDGSLIEPANDNARYFYELVLSSDPGNTAAQQGLTVIASRLALQARAEIDAGRFDEADVLLAEARRLDPESSELEAASRAVADARQRIIDDRRRRAAAREAAERAEAERLAALQAAEEKRRAEAAAAVARLTPQASESSAQPGDAGAAPLAAPVEVPAGTSPVADYVPTEGPGAIAGADAVLSSSPIAVSSLTRTRYVAPKYPRSAERRSLSGWVDVIFTVTTDGTTKDIEIRDSEPGDTFVNAATRAVERWEFEPVVENGQLVEKRAGVRMMFAIE